MAEKRSTFFDGTLLRYVWSFLLVLLLPSGILFLVYNRYFFSRYQNEVFEHYSAEMDNLDMEIVNHVQGMRAIAGQLANLQACQHDNIRESAPSYANIINAFISIVSPQRFFSSMGFYSYAFPDTVFTNHGTYNLRYYKEYAVLGEDFASLRDMTEGLSGERWFSSAQTRTRAGGGGNFCDFVIPISRSGTEYVIFTVPEQSLRRLTAEDEFIILDQEGHMLYASFPVQEGFGRIVADAAGTSVNLGDGKVLFSKRSLETGLYVGLLFPEERILQPIQDVQRLFLLIFLALLVLGGVLVFLLALINYAPVRRLSETASRLVYDIPKGLSRIHATDYALESMGGRVSSLQESVRIQHAIFALIYERGKDEKRLRDNLRNAGLPEDAGGYCAILVHMAGPHRKEYLMERFGRMYAPSGVFTCGMEYLAGNCYLFLAACQEEPESGFIPFLEQAAEAVADSTGFPCQVIVGKQGRDARGLRDSFRQAMQMQQGIPDSTEVLVYREEDMAEFFYPNLELQALYRSLVQQDTDRFSLMYRTLTDTLRNEALPSFAVSSVYCAIINSCLMGIQGICPNAPELRELYAGLSGDMDAAALAGAADKVMHTALELAGRLESRREETDGTIAQVLRYIDDNFQTGEMNVSYVAQAFQLSVSNLSHRFKAQTGKNISDYIREKRLLYTKELLRKSDLTVRDIAECLGYAQPSNFIRKFKAQTGMTPNEFRSLYAEDSDVPPGEQN